MFSFTLFYADCIEQPKNCLYTHKAIICDIASFIEAVSHDYVGSQFKDYKRNNDNFISADCIIMDCDNNHSDNSEDWVTHEDVAKAFPDVAFAVHYSRNHMKLKGDKSPRPKFHVCFPIETITDAQHFSFVAQYTISLFSFFDKSVKDAGRMFFGTLNPQVAFVEGNTKLDDFIRSRSLDYPNDDNAIVSNQSSEACSDIIPEGQRNSTLYQYACKILVRFGENDNSHDNFLKEAQLCSPPLPQNELNTIWSNAVKFYNGQILNRNDYIPPNLYGCYSLKPSDFTDIGQANVFVCKYGEIIKYSPATDFLVFNGSFWEEDNQHARALAQELTEKQLNEAETKIKMAEGEILRMQKSSFPGNTQNERQLKALKEEYADAIIFKDYALKRRNSQRISATLTESAPKITIKTEILDADPYLLNTPSATYDLRYGLNIPHKHIHHDFITKQTAVDPSDNGMNIWLNFLNTIFLHDEHLINYVQQIAGLGAIGLVFETMIIAFGAGNNGKSTLWNSIKNVLGTYSGIISADALTTACRRNIKPEIAELRGKRLIIASELEEGVSLSTSVMKMLASTDTIKAEKKYKDPFEFRPSHTLILMTNYLPDINSGVHSKGTWRRINVIPFAANIPAQNDIKNFSDYLCKNAGGAILSWIIEGAQKIITNEFKLETPEAVLKATGKYKADNDWLDRFLSECCEIGNSFCVKSSEFLAAFKVFNEQTGENSKTASTIRAAMTAKGFTYKQTRNGIIVHGLRLRNS